jgi:hypothetical protein
MTGKNHRVAIVFPADAGARLDSTRHAKTAEALVAAGLEVEGAPYADEVAEEVRAQLEAVDAVLVWVNPIQAGRDRSILNAILATVASKGVVVSAHPDVIEKLGTKEVLHRTRAMSWGCDTHLYRTPESMRSELPKCLISGAARVLKQIKGQSGDGVWKVELASPARGIAGESKLRVRHAKRGCVEEIMPFDGFISICQSYFTATVGMIDQPYQPRLTDGIIRCYIVGDRVAGFGEQLVNALYPGVPGASEVDAPQPGPRLYYPPTRPDFQFLKDKLECQWIGELCGLVDIDRTELPILWDADFLYGPKDAAGLDTHVLCEINVSSVYPFPDDALVPMAAETFSRIKALHS